MKWEYDGETGQLTIVGKDASGQEIRTPSQPGEWYFFHAWDDPTNGTRNISVRAGG